MLSGNEPLFRKLGHVVTASGKLERNESAIQSPAIAAIGHNMSLLDIARTY